MERDPATAVVVGGCRISTHTLTWSVTDTNEIVFTFKYISTHTLTWSVTLHVIGLQCWLVNFNSHAHVERDALCITGKPNISNFNSHAHVERDPHSVSMVSSKSYFNSHAHVERDRSVRGILFLPANFNSHAHVERDVQQKPTTQHPQISTHTLTWSVTVCAAVRTAFEFISTHTLTWSVTQ